jgi:AP-2 complex subunit alpha
MLGYEVDFGHVEFISLLGAANFTEKSVGYMAVGLLLRPEDQLMNLVINSIKNDLNHPVVHAKTLALSAVANIGGDDFASSLAPDVRRCLLEPLQGGTPPNYASNFGGGAPKVVSPEETKRNNNAVYKKACLATLRLYRSNPDVICAADWLPALITLTEFPDMGVVTCAMALINGLASHNQMEYEILLPYVVNILTGLVIDGRCAPDYLYYRVQCPWVQIKCLRFLQYFKEPTGAQWSTLSSVLLRILTRGEQEHDSVNVQNTSYALVFEAIALVVSWGPTDPHGDHYELREMTHRLLGRYIAVNDANIKYLALDMLARVCKVDGIDPAMQAYGNTAVASLGDADMSVRKRALEVIFLITDKHNASSMVADLVVALSTAEETLREDIVVKIAILAERFYENIRWYVDTMIEVIVVAGDHVAEAVWYRIVQTVINNEEVHEYAAQKLFNSVQNKFCHEVCICLAAYLLGEIGFFICDKPGCSGFEQFAALHQHFELISSPSKSLLLTCYIKLSNQYPDVADDVQGIFTKLSRSTELDLQQRACEYGNLPLQGEDIMQSILERMPAWAEKEQSVLHTITAEKEAAKDTADKAASKVTASDKAASRRASMATGANVVNRNPARPGASPSKALTDAELQAKLNGASSGNSNDFAPSGEEAKAVRPVSVDLLSMDDPVANSSFPGSGAAVGLSADEEAKISKLFTRATIAGPAKTILFENDIVSIDCIAEYRGAQGRLTLNVYNKSDHDVTGVAFDVQTVFEGEYLAVKVNPPAATSMGSMDAIKLQVAIASRRPFSGEPQQAPTCTVRFSQHGTAREVPLRLPTTACSFCEPLQISKDQYMAAWRALDGTPQQQAVFALGPSLGSITDTLMEKLRTNLFPKLHLGLVDGIDNANSVTSACSFKTTTLGPNGQPLSVEGYVRMEGDRAGGRFRLTARAKHPKIAQALCQLLQSQLQ